MDVRYAFEGGEQLAKNLASISDRLSRRVQRDALLEGAQPVRTQARATAPRDPGAPDLADHIEAATATGPEGEPAIAVGPVRDFFYGLWLEEGNSRQGAQPFMRPALDSNVPQALRIISAHLWDGIQSRGFGLSSSTSVSTRVAAGPGSGRL